MSYIQITPIGNSLDVAAARLAGVKGGIDRAMASAGKRATSKLKTEASRRARERYAISAGNISGKAPRITVTSGGGSLDAEVQWNGTKFALTKFDGSSKSPAWDKSTRAIIRKADGWITYHPGREGKGHVLRGTGAQLLTGTFVAHFASGHVGIFERDGGTTGSGSEKITEKMGLSVPQMVGSDAIKDDIGQTAIEECDTRLAHEVERLLGF